MDCDDDHDKKIMVLDNDQVVQSPSEEDDVENSSEAVASDDDDDVNEICEEMHLTMTTTTTGVSLAMNGGGGVCVGIFIDGLIHQTCVKKITLWEVHLDLDACDKLASLLRNQGSCLTVLHLYANDIGNGGAIKLAKGFLHNSTLKELMLREFEAMEVGQKAIFDSLQHTKCKLEMLHLRVHNIKEASALSLSCVLRHHHGTIKSLQLDGSFKSVKYDDEDDNIGIICQPMLGHNSVLEKLVLSNDILTNAVVYALTKALTENNRLRMLDLSNNLHVSAEAWEIFSEVLRNPYSVLEILKLGECYNVDEVMHSFADALSRNKMLKELRVGGLFVTYDAIDALIHTLCNTSSILSTFNSNHTLERICNARDEVYYSDDLMCLLRINRHNTKSEAARLKIIKSHFSGPSMNNTPFNVDKMKLRVRPHAIAWMAKGKHLYQFLRAMPWLIRKVEDNAVSNSKKRSRDE
jgi:hypothetical protein